MLNSERIKGGIAPLNKGESLGLAPLEPELSLAQYLEVHPQEKFTFVSQPKTTTLINAGDYKSSNELISLRDNLISSYDPKHSKTIGNIALCGTRNILLVCPDCNTIKLPIWYCNNRFCKMWECATKRQKTYQEQLTTLQKHTKRVYHFTIGSNELTKKELQNSIIKLFRALRHNNKIRWLNDLRFANIKAFDISKKNYQKTGKLWLHFHIAIIQEKIIPAMFIPTIKKLLKKISPLAVFNNIGYRSSKNVFSYFAKRCAGIYGHRKPGYYYLSDLITPQKYLDTYKLSKFMTFSLPKRLVNTIRRVPHNNTCPNCSSVMQRIKFVYFDDEILGYDPPY